MSSVVNRTVTVTQDFIDYRDNEIKYGNYSKKNNYKNTDYLLLEYDSIKNKLIEPPIKYKWENKAWRHDGIYDKRMKDFKHIYLPKLMTLTSKAIGNFVRTLSSL